MSISPYLKKLRSKIGNDLVLLPAVTVANFDESGRILMLRHRETNTGVTPGGMIEPGERPADAAVREMWEETALHVALSSLVGVSGGPLFTVNYLNGDSCNYVSNAFASKEKSVNARAYM